MTEQRPELLDPARHASIDGVLRAAAKVEAMLPPTPLIEHEIDGVTYWFKCENLQPIGAFKIRGGWHRLTDLSNDERQRGVVAFSSGNHAQGVAWAAQNLGIPALIVMPDDAPASKVAGTRDLGAEIVFYNRRTEDRAAIAAKIAEERGAVVVPSYDDPWIIEGQGTLAIEVEQDMLLEIEELPARFICGCGGGGMASGIALACPEADLVIVEPEGWDDMRQSIAAGHIIPVADDAPPTLCDALQTIRVSERTFSILRDVATPLVVSEDEVKAAVRYAFEHLHLVVEPGGAAGLAAVLAGKVEPVENSVIVLSGGNVDAAVYSGILAEG